MWSFSSATPPKFGNFLVEGCPPDRITMADKPEASRGGNSLMAKVS